MHETGSDYTLTFRALTELAAPQSPGDAQVSAFFQLPRELDAWIARWQERLARDPSPLDERLATMGSSNPAIIPRNTLVQEAIDAAVLANDFSAFHALADVLADPYGYGPERERFARPPAPGQPATVTFCGT